MEYDGTRENAAEIAHEVFRLYAAGERGRLVYNGVELDLSAIGFGARFVRVCMEAAAGKGAWSLRLLAPATARDVERQLRAADMFADGPAPGVIVGLTSSTYGPGQMGVCLDEKRFAFNGGRDQPGYLIWTLWSMQMRISGYYAVLPTRE